MNRESLSPTAEIDKVESEMTNVAKHEFDHFSNESLKLTELKRSYEIALSNFEFLKLRAQTIRRRLTEDVSFRTDLSDDEEVISFNPDTQQASKSQSSPLLPISTRSQPPPAPQFRDIVEHQFQLYTGASCLPYFASRELDELVTSKNPKKLLPVLGEEPALAEVRIASSYKSEGATITFRVTCSMSSVKEVKLNAYVFAHSLLENPWKTVVTSKNMGVGPFNGEFFLKNMQFTNQDNRVVFLAFQTKSGFKYSKNSTPFAVWIKDEVLEKCLWTRQPSP